jgi:hypothetical protein
LLTLVALGLWSAPASAQCTTPKCPDEAMITAARAAIFEDCDCIGAESHGKYGKCVKGVMKTLLNQGTLSKACKKAVQRCEMQSTCGREGAIVCCGTPDASAAASGPAKAKVMKKASKCQGTVCSEVPHAADACTVQGTCAPPITAVKPFKAIQDVFTVSCALPTCHSALAREGGLVLSDEEVSYNSLVDVPAELPEADGMLRVKSGDPANSLLIRKLRHEGPGEEMPDNLPPLGEGTIGMIERWIERGAHTTEEECPSAAGGTLPTRPESFTPLHGGGDHRTICDPDTGTGDYVWTQEPPLEVPAENEGIQLYAPPRSVTSGSEWETCIAIKPDWKAIRAKIGVPNTVPLTLKRQEYRMHSGSHHLLVYGYFGTDPDAFPDGYFDCTAGQCHNPGDCPRDNRTQIPIGGTQVAGTRYIVEYPPSIGIPIFGDNQVIILNLHYTNPFLPAQDIFGEAWVNFYFHQAGEFTSPLDGIFAINYRDLVIEPFETRTISSIWQPQGLLSNQPADAAVFQLFGHMHKRGDNFQIDYVRDGKCSDMDRLCGRDADCACKPSFGSNCVQGQTCVKGPNAEDTRIYYTDSWDHAPVLDYPAPWMRVNKDEGLRWSCQMTNGVQGDPGKPPKLCHERCGSCGWLGGTCSTNGAACAVGETGCGADRVCVAAPANSNSPTGYACQKPEGGGFIGSCCPEPDPDPSSDTDAQCVPNPEGEGYCHFTRGTYLGFHDAPRDYQAGDPMPLVFGDLADDDMCNMFGYFLNKAAADRLIEDGIVQ